MLDALSEASQPSGSSDQPSGMDPYNDHPEAMEAIRQQSSGGLVPEGMNLPDISAGVIP